MDRRRAPKGRLRRIAPVAGSAALVVLMTAACTAEEAPQPRTVAVERGTVADGVSATGSFSAITQQNVGFPNGGQLTNVMVKVGDKVEAGQVLATVDDFAVRQVLAQEQGQLHTQQALLGQLESSPVASGAKDSLSQAEDILDATKRQSKEVLEGDEVAIDNAERQLAIDRKAVDSAEDKLAADRRACDDDDEPRARVEGNDDDNDSPSPSPSPGGSTRPGGDDDSSGTDGDDRRSRDSDDDDDDDGEVEEAGLDRFH
ncbi:MAG: biotin/lipoyl-binding protein, partial [Pseudonocardia sp.]